VPTAFRTESRHKPQPENKTRPGHSDVRRSTPSDLRFCVRIIATKARSPRRERSALSPAIPLFLIRKVNTDLGDGKGSVRFSLVQLRWTAILIVIT